MNILCGNKLKQKYILCFYYFCFFLLFGCSFPSMWHNPGYSVFLNIKKCQSIDFKNIENFFKSNGYILEVKNFKDNKDVFQYSKKVIENVKIKDPKITIVILWEKTEIDECKNIRISVQNWYDGNEEKIKEEINNISYKLKNLISSMVDEKNIELIKKNTGPPF